MIEIYGQATNNNKKLNELNFHPEKNIDCFHLLMMMMKLKIKFEVPMYSEVIYPIYVQENKKQN